MMLAIIGVTVLVLLLIGFIVRQRQEINQLKDTIIDFDWNLLGKLTPYIAMDERGVWYAYNRKPKQIPYNNYWGGADSIRIPQEHAPKNYTGDWEDSLFKNPNLD